MRQAEDATVAPPERRIIERPRLLKQLEETEARTILLIAPAGYGKTTLARQWARNREAAWFAATHGSADVVALARGLAGAFASAAPAISEQLNETVCAIQDPGRDLGILVEVFVSHFGKRAETSLVIDDYHFLAASPRAEQFVEALRRTGVPRLLIASRVRPSWVTVREQIYGESFELRHRDLALDPSETAQVIGNADRVRDVIQRAHGWPAVIGLAAVAGAPGAPPQETIPDTLYDYLAEESFNRAEQATQEALLAIVLLPALDNDTLSNEFGDQAHAIVAAAAGTGLIESTPTGVELHPLARDFLFERLRRTPVAKQRVRRAVRNAIDHRAWDEAFLLITTFQLHSEMDALITASYSPLLGRGHVETLERFNSHAVAHLKIASPVTDLVSAQIALRDGSLEQAQQLAVAAANRLPPRHPLKPRGYILGGAAALVRFDLHESYRLHSLALEFSSRKHRQDERDALWGQCLALIYLEDRASVEAAQRLEELSETSVEDRIRAATAHLLVSRSSSGLRNIEAALAARDLLDQTHDPRVRTSFGNVCSYVLGLQGRYDEAEELISRSLADTDAYGLQFTRPHLFWTKAFVALGLRRFSQADAHLRLVEAAAHGSEGTHFELNTRSLRARILLVEHRAEEAIEVTAPVWESVPTRAMHGEYLATAALARAVVGRSAAARRLVSRARGLSSVVEVQTLTVTAEAIATIDTKRAGVAAERAFDLASRLETWDALVCGVRSVPKLLEVLATRRIDKRRLLKVLELSHDHSLLRACGLSTERTYGRSGILSRREQEVLDLLRQGLTNREIALTLYIAEATAKVHVRHILEKLGARTRTEAVARYAISADETSRGSSNVSAGSS